MMLYFHLLVVVLLWAVENQERQENKEKLGKHVNPEEPKEGQEEQENKLKKQFKYILEYIFIKWQHI